MSVKKMALGRGLGALIPDNIEDTLDLSRYTLENVSIHDIKQNAFQPRKQFDQQEIYALSLSISRHGVLQPIILRRINQGYEIVAGERRWRASKLANMDTIPALIMNESDEKFFEISLIENIQRVDLNSIEEGLAYSTLIEKYNMTQQQVSDVVGKSRAHITNTIRLLQLVDRVQELVIDGKLTMGHARCLVPLKEEQQLAIAERIVKESLSVRDVESLIKKMAQPVTPKIAIETDPYINEIEKKLTDFIGSKVTISHSINKGRIQIEYYSEDDLERILSIIQ